MTTSSLDDLSVDVRRWIALETALFEVLGTEARSGAHPPRLRRVLATWCHRHAWHAELWRQRLPEVAHHTFPDAGDLDFADRSAALIRERIGALVDPVLSGMRDHLAAHRERIDPVLDGPTARVLDLVEADLDRELSDLAEAFAD